MPKKPKIVQSKNQEPAEAGGSIPEVKPANAPRPRRAVTSRKKIGAKKVPAPEAANVPTPQEVGVPADPSDEQIRLRAYFISERRRRFALPGDAESDWLEAKRQLLSDAGRR